MPMKGRWAAGIPPRNFTWILADQLAISERPGGYARNHRKVRRQEEIIWLREQGFTRVVSLLGSTHNLHAYDEEGLAWSHIPLPSSGDITEELTDLYRSIDAWLGEGQQLLLHQEELGDRIMGVASAYLVWSGRLKDPPMAITAVERLVHRHMGPSGRELLTMVGAR
ncbi:MAG TPA: hypothetical protein VFH45_09400 [Acidimicrobiales bacterium]|nr:hypothetical protein [Acidimicrobiales bacterium]